MANPSNEKPAEDAASEENRLPSYVPPRVESVLTAEEVEREALYAGGVTVVKPPG